MVTVIVYVADENDSRVARPGCSGRRLRRRLGHEREEVGGRRLLPARLRGRPDRRVEGRRAQPDSARGRAARHRAHAPRCRPASAGRRRALPLTRLPAGGRAGGRGRTGQARRRARRPRPAPRRGRRGGEVRPSRLARPGPFRADRAADRRRPRRARAGGRPGPKRACARRRVPAWSRPLRPPRLRHESRRLRLPRRPLPPAPGADHRDRPRVGAEPTAAARADRPRPPRARPHGLLRAARLAAPGRDGRPRRRREGGGARPDRGPDPVRAGERRQLPDAHAPKPASATERSRMPLAVEFRGVEFAYPHGPPVLREADLQVEAGEFLAIAGPNGGGKTTLLRLALGLEHPTRGAVRLFGEPPARFGERARLGYLPQRAQLGVQAPATVREIVAAGRSPLKPFGRLRSADREAIEAAIERVGLVPVARRPLSRLSGGQQQRAFIAKALVADPALLALDEPTAGVDVEAQGALAQLLSRLHGELGVTILYVSHEFGAIEHVVERLVLVRERILFDGPPASLPGISHDPSHVHV